MVNVSEVIESLTEKEKTCIILISEGLRGKELQQRLEYEGITEDTFRYLVDIKLSSELLLLLMGMCDEWL